MLSFSSNALKTTEAQAEILAQHYPEGRVWAEKYDKTKDLRKLISGSGEEFLRQIEFTDELANDLDLNQTINLLERWETSVGIPDECFSTSEDLVTRRLQVLQKLIDYDGAQTEGDFIDIAALFGFTITIERLGPESVFAIPFPLNFFPGSGKEARNTIFVILPGVETVFPLVFPLQFAANSGVILECIFRSLVPATTKVIFQFGS